MKELTNFSLLLIPYLTICGALYHISYWQIFDLNGLAFINVIDIIKSSVYPILSILFLTICSNIFFLFVDPFGFYLFDSEGANTKVGKLLNTNVGIKLSIFIWLTLLSSFFVFDLNTGRWYVFGTLASVPPAIILHNSEILSGFAKNLKIRFLIFQILVYLPVFAFATGKYESETIFRNGKYKYIEKLSKNKSKVDTLKVLGMTDKYIVLSNLKNSEIIFLKSDKIDTLIVKTKKYWIYKIWIIAINNYIEVKFNLYIKNLTVGEGDIRQRLSESFFYIHNLKTDDFPL